VACTAIIAAAVVHARDAARDASPRDRPIWLTRLRKLEALAAWATSAE
jgi:hypothetical protein